MCTTQNPFRAKPLASDVAQVGRIDHRRHFGHGSHPKSNNEEPRMATLQNYDTKMVVNHLILVCETTVRQLKVIWMPDSLCILFRLVLRTSNKCIWTMEARHCGYTLNGKSETIMKNHLRAGLLPPKIASKRVRDSTWIEI